MQATRRLLSTASAPSVKQRLLQAALQQVPQYGWTNDALVAASMEVGGGASGSSLSLAGMITIPDLITYSMNHWNDQLQRDLSAAAAAANATTTGNKEGQPKVSTPDFIVHAMKTRLSYVQDLIQAGRWHEGMAAGAHPTQIQTTQQQLQDLIGIISSNHQQTTGDSSSFSTLEQLGLGAVYVATELHMLSDKSPHFSDTWQFLQERVENWDSLRKQPLQPSAFLSRLSVPTSGTGVALPSSDSFVAASQVAWSLASGVVSMIAPNLSPHFPPFPQQQQQQQKHAQDGTHPSHYDAPEKPTVQSTTKVNEPTTKLGENKK